MTFSVYVPQHPDGAKLPVVWYLSGLTCTHANVTEKGEFRRACAELGLIFVAPDTSPRGPDVPGDPNNSYDFGLGAGFYVDATQPPFALNYRMWSYVTDELPKLLAENFPVDARRQSVMGHSMGGHGALTVALLGPVNAAIAVAAMAVNVHAGLGRGSAGFALSYGAVRFLLVGEYLGAHIFVPAARSLTKRFALGFGVAAAIWRKPSTSEALRARIWSRPMGRRDSAARDRSATSCPAATAIPMRPT